MCPIQYYTMIRQSKDPKYIRLEIVRFAKEHGIKPAARAFSTTVKTVRKWLRRWQPGRLYTLDDISRAPKNPCSAVPANQRILAVKYKKECPSWGAERIRDIYGLTISEKAIRNIWRKDGLLKRRRRKHKTKNDLRKVKSLWRLFQQLDIDTKDLIDIPELWPQIHQHNLPKVQYTARDVVSGVQFIAYAQERSLTYADLFAKILINHFQTCNVNLDGCFFQTDNGSEFIGSWQAKDDSAFTKTVESVPGLTHKTIPPRAYTWQADVETVHSLIESEFYEVESFSSRDDFIRKASSYTIWFNVARKNSYKDYKTPWEIIRSRSSAINPYIAALPAFFLDEAFANFLDSKGKRGYDVLPRPYFLLMMENGTNIVPPWLRY